ncbi:Sulfite reductase [NADPH] hemoprotein beta-component, partial [Dissostichus eleginoides]
LELLFKKVRVRMQGEEINKVSWLSIFLACSRGVFRLRGGGRRVEGEDKSKSFVWHCVGGAAGGEVAVGSGEGMTSGTKPVLPASAMTLAAEGICTAEKFK